MNDFYDRILLEIKSLGKVKARTLAKKFNIEKCEMNRILYFVLKEDGQVDVDENFYWFCV